MNGSALTLTLFWVTDRLKGRLFDPKMILSVILKVEESIEKVALAWLTAQESGVTNKRCQICHPNMKIPCLFSGPCEPELHPGPLEADAPGLHRHRQAPAKH